MATGGHIGIHTGKKDREKDPISGVSLTTKIFLRQ